MAKTILGMYIQRAERACAVTFVLLYKAQMIFLFGVLFRKRTSISHLSSIKSCINALISTESNRTALSCPLSALK